MKIWAALFGLVLVVLWIVGLSTPDSSATWLTWLDGVGAICSFLVAGAIGRDRGRKLNFRSTLAMAIGLGALWIIGMATDGAPYQNWWTFGAGLGFLIESLVLYTRPEARPAMTVEEEQERLKKAG